MAIKQADMRQITALAMGANALNKDAIDSGDNYHDRFEYVTVLLEIQIGLALELEKSITDDDPPASTIIVPDT